MRAQIEASQARRLEIGDDIKEKLAQKLADAELDTARAEAARRMRERCTKLARDKYDEEMAKARKTTYGEQYGHECAAEAADQLGAAMSALPLEPAEKEDGK